MEKVTLIKLQILALQKKLQEDKPVNRYALNNKIKALKKQLNNVREVTAWNNYLAQ
jgi:hypothetical protein